MKTVPLYGKRARGRVALVNDEDYDLVMQYRWNVQETLREPPRQSDGPYAFTSVPARVTGKRGVLYMHILIMGVKGVDHIDHDTLNNQRYNLRPATDQQNRRNTRNRIGYSSQYKGVFWEKKKRVWHALITVDSRSRHLGFYASEVGAALAYDEAAREIFGEFAYPNFPDDIPQAERDRLRAESDAAEAEREAGKRRAMSARSTDWWTERLSETRVCTICGAEYVTRSSRTSLYCGGTCAKRAQRLRDRQRSLEGVLF